MKPAGASPSRSSLATEAGLKCRFPLTAEGLVTVALKRYTGAMATVQVRELPEESYEVLRRRARRAGKSLQAYTRDQLVELAGRPTKEEAIDALESVLARVSGGDLTGTSIVEDLAAERR